MDSVDLAGLGYKHEGPGKCRACPATIEWYLTPNNRDPEDVRRYAQDKKLDPADLVESWTDGGGQKYRDAQRGAGPIEIPLKHYISRVTPSEHAPAMNDIVRIGNSEAMNVKELKNLQQSAAEEPGS